MMVASQEIALRQIFERLGSIDARLTAGAARHDKIDGELEEIKEAIRHVPKFADTVAKMEPIVDDYERSKSKAIGFMLALAVLWSVMVAFLTEIKAFLFGKP